MVGINLTSLHTSDLESPGWLAAYGMFLGENSVGTDDRVSQDCRWAVIAVGPHVTATRHRWIPPKDDLCHQDYHGSPVNPQTRKKSFPNSARAIKASF